jgi:predicted nucleic acid-binding protein
MRRAGRLSATEASRSFARLLDEVEAGSQFLIHRVRHGRAPGGSRRRRGGRVARRTEFVEAILAAIPVVPLTLAIARLYGELDARFVTEGRRLPTSDLLVACTALHRDDELVTGNPRHCDRVPELVVRRYA